MTRQKRTVTVRLDPDQYDSYATLCQDAGFPASEGIRSLVAEANAKQQAIARAEISVDFHFDEIPDTIQAQHPEYVGTLTVTVTPPKTLSMDDLDKLVFISPEFFNDEGEEHYRVDSHHYLRVCTDQISIESSKLRRNVLSHRLVKGQWKCGVFVYENVDSKEMLADIKNTISQRMIGTIVCYQAGLLPDHRVLTSKDQADLYAMHPEFKTAGI